MNLTWLVIFILSQFISFSYFLVDSHYNSYLRTQHEFSRLCNSLDEFHFENSSKVKQIQDNVMPVQG